jgi:transposase
MTPREERGLIIAGTQKLTQKGKVWLVPSQNGSGKYTVCPDHDTPYCSCPDHEETGLPCKHVFAVRFTMKREQQADGTITETQSMTFTRKKTYTQDWPMYQVAQIEEKKRFLKLLFDLCIGLPEPVPSKTGRAPTPIADIVFSCVYKVYSTLSSRRFGTDLEDAHEKGYVMTKLHPVMVGTFLGRKILTPILQDLIVRTSLPLKAIETTFAPDSTGFSTSRFVRWFDEKYGRERSGKDWVKAHAIFGVKTNVATSVEIAERNAGDCPMFKPLVEKTAENFTVKEVPADKAYLSHENFDLVNKLGGTAYIPFKSNSVQGEGGDVWEKMYLYYQLRREEFCQHYHLRSNAESGFSMIKAKFRDNVRSTNDVAMKNEVLCKFICHNICCVIQSQLELGIVPVFWKDAQQENAATAIVTAPEQQTEEPKVEEDEPDSPFQPRFMCGA